MTIRSTTPAKFHVTPKPAKTLATEAPDPAQFEIQPQDAGVGLFTVNDEVFGPSTLTFQSVVTVASTPAVFTMHVVSDFDFTPGNGVDEFTGNQWITVGIGIGGSF